MNRSSRVARLGVSPDATLEHHSCHGIDVAGQDRTAPRRSGTTSGFTIADRSAGARSSPPAHRGARVIRTDASRFMLISQEPRGGQERKQDSEDDPDINAHQSSPAAAWPTNSSLTDGIYFDDGFCSYFKALSAAFPASVMSYSMCCVLGDCDERLI